MLHNRRGFEELIIDSFDEEEIERELDHALHFSYRNEIGGWKANYTIGKLHGLSNNRWFVLNDFLNV